MTVGDHSLVVSPSGTVGSTSSHGHDGPTHLAGRSAVHTMASSSTVELRCNTGKHMSGDTSVPCNEHKKSKIAVVILITAALTPHSIV